MELQIGEYFEIFVRGLKSHLGGFFDVVSSAIDFAITALERILSMDSTVWYPAVLVFLIIGSLVYLLGKRKLPFKMALGMGLACVLLLGAAESWRRNVISQETDPAKAGQLAVELTSYRQALASTANETFSETGVLTMDRIIMRLQSVSQPRKMVGLLGERTYERYLTLYSQVRKEANGSLKEQARGIHKLVQEYNPNRLGWYSWLIITTMLTLLAWLCASSWLAIFTAIGMGLIMNMGFWSYTTDTLALVISATGFALLLGVPLGIAAAANKSVDHISKPILDFMQTMPAFVYLIPAVLLFGLGKVPGAMATLIFAMPPAVRLTNLGIRSVPKEVVEAAQSFGSTPLQLLFKAQLPIAIPTILAGLNQTIMLSLSMVVIGGMIGAGGLGEVVLRGITQLKIGLGFESGLSVVILAIYLDRLTQALGSYKR